jgi:uncharacterized membrane protein YeaQ/YmgE (transglycosylase-associated protein family)
MDLGIISPWCVYRLESLPMFKPSDPDKPTSTPPEPLGIPPAFALSHLGLGSVFLASGTVGLLYGSLVEKLARPEAGEGLISGLFAGLAASLGGVFQSLGWVLLGLGFPLALAGWGWNNSKSWARPLTQILGIAGALAGIWLLTRFAFVEALLPLSYAALVGWVLGKR